MKPMTTITMSGVQLRSSPSSSMSAKLLSGLPCYFLNANAMDTIALPYACTKADAVFVETGLTHVGPNSTAYDFAINEGIIDVQSPVAKITPAFCSASWFHSVLILVTSTSSFQFSRSAMKQTPT
jgi:hypothetical protein